MALGIPIAHVTPRLPFMAITETLESPSEFTSGHITWQALAHGTDSLAS